MGSVSRFPPRLQPGAAGDFDLELIEGRMLDGNIQELIYRPTLHDRVRPSTRTPSRSRTPEAQCSLVADTGLVAALPLSLPQAEAGAMIAGPRARRRRSFVKSGVIVAWRDADRACRWGQRLRSASSSATLSAFSASACP